jgi:hypothetical protein
MLKLQSRSIEKGPRRSAAVLAGVLAAFACAPAALAAPVDLSTWSNTAGGNWNVAGDTSSVLQTVNGNSTIFYSGGQDQGKALSGTITVQTTSDDDFIGFVLGYNDGDQTSATADYILIDWKQGTQGSFGCSADKGLAISLVSGPLANNSGAWCKDPANNVTELARANTLGDTGWVDNQTYSFDLTFTDSLIEVFVNGILELSVSGVFANGSFGFYNYSQANVRYAGIEEEVLPPTSEVPLPAALPLMLAGLAGLRFASRSKRAKA